MLERALSSDPDSIPAMGRLATVLLEDHQGERLVTAFRGAIASARSSDAIVMLGSEIARVARRGALFSVPNSGAIPRYAPLWVVPWHLLEGSHVNFFNVASFRRLLAGSFAHVEVTEYGELPVAAADGTRVYNHLFAVAMHADDGPG